MALSVCMRRLTKERERFTTDSPEYWVNWKDENLRQFDAFIVGPADSVYKHKLIKLRFDVPDQYPIVPPKVKFIQHTGDRLHPNLYTEGKVCLSILGTWTGPGWTGNMNIESVLITLRSLLDQQPYLHEPHQSDRPEFNNYVRYHGWRWLLLDYLDRETDVEAKTWLSGYMVKHSSNMILELESQRDAMLRGGRTGMSSPYNVRARHTVDYDRLLSDLKLRIPHIVAPAPSVVTARPPMEDVGTKRKLPFECEHASAAALSQLPIKKPRVLVDLCGSSDTPAAPPAKRLATAPAEVIDLTDD